MLVVQEDIDRYGRIVRHVFVGDAYVNRKMVQEGYAWIYRQYKTDKSRLQDEQAARDAKKGLGVFQILIKFPPMEKRS